MADDIRSDIIIGVDTSVGIAEIKNLQRQISQLNTQLVQSGARQASAAQNIQRNLMNNINATGKFAAGIRNISSTAESFTTSLERNKLSMGEYFRYAGGATKTFGRLFKQEFDTIQQVAESRVKTLQTQYIKLGRDANGALKAISVRPLALDMENLATKTAIAAQKQQLLNQLLKQGSTNLLNFGKNTQWAGRQLMVGFTIPLAMLATQAGKTFMQMEEQAIRFKRVYGDTFTATEETDKMIEQVKQLALEFTKYGVAVEKTMAMAADAAAMGLQNADLLAQVAQSTRLAVLGGVEQEQALETTISLTSAFGTASRDLAKDIEFLNAVENQTVTAIEDLTIAIPKAAPVIKQLGGDVKDLAFFLTAMKEGGINASEGANALKSGLASLINPTEKAAEFLRGFGIDLKGLVDANKGDVKGLVIDFAQALDALDPLNRARAIEQLFGKFQFARLSTLFQNVIKEGTQASRVLQLTSNSTEELAILAERELKRVEDSPMFQFKKAVEELRTALVPLGEAFVKAITPVIEFAKGFLDRFNEMGEGARNFAVVATTVVAGIGPVLLMTFGLVANGVANLIKMFGFLSNIFKGAGKTSTDLGLSTDYMTQQQLEAASVAASLDQTHSKLIQTFNAEAGSVDRLASAYGRAVVAQSRLLNIPIGPRNPAGQAPLKLSSGIFSVPGPKGAGDVVPAMLSPGEAVIPARQSQKYAGLIQALISDSVPGFSIGRNPFAFMLNRSRVAVRTKKEDLLSMIAGGKNARYKSAFETGTGADYLNVVGRPNPAQAKLRQQMEEAVFGLGPDTPASARPTYGYARTSPFQALVNKLFGFKGRQYNAVTANQRIGDKDPNAHWTNPKTGKYEPNPNYQVDRLQRYGDIDLITKRSVGRRSSAAVSDILMDYNYYQESGGRFHRPFRVSPVSMRGSGDFERAQFNSRLGNPFGQYQADPINEPQYWTANPKPPYVETYTPGGFSLKEVSKIRVASRSEAKELQKLVDQAGLRIRVTPQNAPIAIRALANIFGTRFNEGTLGAKTPGLVRAHIWDDLDPSDPSILRQLQALYGSNVTAQDFSSGYKIVGNLTADLPAWVNENLKRQSGVPIDQFDTVWKNVDNKLLSSAIATGLPDNQETRKLVASLEKTLGNRIKAMARLSGTGAVTDAILAQATRQELSRIVKRSPNSPLGSLASGLMGMGQTVGGVRGQFAAGGLRADSVIRRQIQEGRLVRKGRMFFDAITGARVARFNMPSSKTRPADRAAAEAEISKWIASGGDLASMPQISLKADSGKPSEIAGGYQTRSILASVKDPAVMDRSSFFSRFGFSKAAASAVDTTVANTMNKRSRAASPSKETAKAAENLVDGVVVGVEDGAKKARESGKKLASAYVDGTERVRVTAGGQFRDRETNKRISRDEAQRIMRLDAQNERRRKIAEANKAAAEKRSAGISQAYGLSATQFDAMSKDEQQKMRIERKRREIEARQLRIQERNARIADEERIAKEKERLRIKEEKRAARAERFSGQGGRIAGIAGTAAMVGTMGASMMGGQIGEIAQQLMMPAMMLPMILPMLTNPIGLAATAIGGLVVAAFAVSEQFKKNVKEAYNLAMATGASAESLKSFSEFSGRVTAGEIMDRRRAAGVDVFQIAAGKTGFGANFLQSDAGKGLLEGLGQNIATIGREGAMQSLSNQMITAVASGALSASQARDIVATIGAEMQDYNFSISVNSKLLSILGPDGENLLSDPLQIRLNLISDTRNQIEAIIPEFKDVETRLNTFTEEALIWLGNNFLGQDNLTNEDLINQRNTATAEQAGRFVGVSAIALQTQQEMVDSLDLEYERRIANAKAAGDMAEVIRLQDEREQKRSELLKENAKTFEQIKQTFSKMSNQEQVLSSMSDQIKSMFESDKLVSGMLPDLLNKLAELDPTSEMVLKMSLLSGDLSPVALSNMLAKDNHKITVDLITRVGAATATRVNQLSEMFGDQTVQGRVFGPEGARGGTQTLRASDKIKEDVLGMSPGEVDDFLAKFDPIIQALSAAGPQALSAGLAFYYENQDLLEKATTDLENLKKQVGKKPITVKLVQELVGKDVADKIRSDQEYFDSLDDDQKITYTTVLKMIGEMTPEAKKIMAINYAMGEGAAAFKKASGGMSYLQAAQSGMGQTGADTVAMNLFDTNYAKDVTSASVGGKNNNKGDNNKKDTGGGKQDPLNSILARLKQVRDEAINATGGVKELIRVLGGAKDITKFMGTNQRLRSQGANQDFLDFIEGLDAAERKRYVDKTKNGIVKLTNAGKALNKAFGEIAIGEFQDSMAASATDSNNQLIAFRKLVSAGMSVSQAMDAVQNSTLAAAVASKKFSKKELNDMVAAANRAEKAMTRLQAVTNLREGITGTRGQQQVNERFRINDTRFSEIEQSIIQLDPVLLQTYTDFLSGKINSLPAEFGERLKQLMSDVDFQKKVFDEAFSGAMNAFSVLEEQIRLDFEFGINDSGFNKAKVNVSKLRDEITSAENDIANIAFDIDNYDAGLSKISDEEESINSEYDKRLDALDKIEKINDSLIAQQKNQLGLAEALTKGDIASAAQAAQEMRATSAANSIQSQRDLIESSRQRRLGQLTASVNNEVLNREEIEKRIKKLQKDIFDIEEQRLEPAREAVREAELLIESSNKSLKVAGLTKEEWNKQKNSIEAAIVSSDAYQLSLKAALDLVAGIKAYWDGLDGRIVKTTHQITTQTVGGGGGGTVTQPGVLVPPAPGWTWDDDRGGWKPPANSTGGGFVVGEGGTLTELPNPNQAIIDDLNRDILTTRQRIRDKDYTSEAQKERLIDMNIARIQRVRELGGVAASNGGLIPKKYNMGGFIRKFASGGYALGTDTVPAMLTPGEFVVSKYAVDNFGVEKLKAINSGTYTGDSMYNYEVNVNVKSDANPEQIARVVMSQIKQIDSQRIRSNRF